MDTVPLELELKSISMDGARIDLANIDSELSDNEHQNVRILYRVVDTEFYIIEDAKVSMVDGKIYKETQRMEFISKEG